MSVRGMVGRWIFTCVYDWRCPFVVLTYVGCFMVLRCCVRWLALRVWCVAGMSGVCCLGVVMFG